MHLFIHKILLIIKNFISNISKEAFTVLKIGLPIISAALIALSWQMVDEVESKPVTVMITYPAMFEHILAALLLLLIGAFAFDWISKRKY